jgi:hypothetical protein
VLSAAMPGEGRAESPLDRLRQRSADERWQTIRPTAPSTRTATGSVEQAGAVVPTPAPAPSSTRAPRPAPIERRTVTIPRPVAPSPSGSADTPAPPPRRNPRAVDVLPMLPAEEYESAAEPRVRHLFDPPGTPAGVVRTGGEERLVLQSPELLPVPEGRDAPRRGDNETYELSPIHDILPYADYEPDPELARDDPCANQCPRPPGCPPSEGSSLCPEEYDLPYVAGDLRSPGEIVFAWEASNLYSNPLYFDDPKLERYGHTYHPVVQPFVSTGRFGVQLLALPYKATIDPYCKRMYALGFYRPGDCAPEQIEPIPWNRDAALMQGAATTGAIFLIP